MTLSIVIATKDRAAFLARALESLAIQRDAPPFEVIVADNGSTDGTSEVCTRMSASGALALRTTFVAQPNRGAARNAGIALATGETVLFVDDDVCVPDGFVAAHARAQERNGAAAVSGPILNVPGYASRPRPTILNYSAAFFCTCNVSVPRSALRDVGGFDERFHLYGWEDTELGLRLRAAGIKRRFAWDAFLWHIKPAGVETLEVVTKKTRERARMAARLLQKNGGLRTRLATGAYSVNYVRSAALSPPWSLERYRRFAENLQLAAPLRAFARSQYLDGVYVQTLRSALAAENVGRDDGSPVR